MQTSSVSQKGQVTIPASVRKQLGIGTGDAVAFETEGDRVYLKAVPSSIEASFGLVKARRSATLEEMDDAVRKRGAGKP